MNWHTQHKQNLSIVARVEEAIANFCGTRTFFLIHVVWFGFWLFKPVEQFPFNFLTMMVSLEAILLSSIIMINQRRHDAIAAAGAEHDKRVETEKLDKILEAFEELFTHLPQEFIDLRRAMQMDTHTIKSALDTGERYEKLREATSGEALRSVAIAAALFAQPGTLKEVKRKKR